MQIIGITGGIGSGKSTITRELVRRGYSVYDCDHEAKRIIAENKEVRKAIVALLGEEAFVGGEYNTAYVAHRVFSDPALLKSLNSIVHPAVIRDIHTLAHSFMGLKSMIFIESAILYESGFDRLCDKVFFVDAPEEIRVARTIARDHCEEEQVRARIRSQHSRPHEKAIVLINDGSISIADLADQLLQMLK